MRAIVRWSLKNKSVVFLATVILIASGAYATTRLNLGGKENPYE